MLKDYMERKVVKRARAKLLKSWRKALKKPTLKEPPKYNVLARARGIPIQDIIKTTRGRSILDEMSKAYNMMHPPTSLRLNQNPGHGNVRTDGLVGTLDTKCGDVFFPTFGSFLSPQQCFALQGFEVGALNFGGIADGSLFAMAGNTMAIPCVGTVTMACLDCLDAC